MLLVVVAVVVVVAAVVAVAAVVVMHAIVLISRCCLRCLYDSVLILVSWQMSDDEAPDQDTNAENDGDDNKVSLCITCSKSR